VTVPDGLISMVAARLAVPVESVRALWPASEQMRGEMLLALAREGLAGRADDDALIGAWNRLGAHSGIVATPAGRRRLLADLVRLIARHSIGEVTSSMRWRNYVACAAGVAETPRLSRALGRSLQQSDEEFIAHLAVFYENVLSLIGYRLSPRLRDDHRAFAVALASVIDGLGIAHQGNPAVVESPFGLAKTEPETFAELLIGSVVGSLLEIDPGFSPEKAIERLTNGLQFDHVVP
jgi:hypothetical protein